MILSGSKIREEIDKSIFITPFDENRINSNSYYLSLADHLYIYDEETLDMKSDYKGSMKRIDIPNEGLVLSPGKLY
ncbi:MAG: dCTP deaminase, partial [Clostridiales bacterium]|nr:dCTP deaminase [Clostridiales bacterium]